MGWWGIAALQDEKNNKRICLFLTELTNAKQAKIVRFEQIWLFIKLRSVPACAGRLKFQ